MMDIETLLQSDAAQWQRTVDAGAVPGPHRSSGVVTAPPRRPRLRTTIFAVAAVVIVAAGAALITHIRSEHAAQKEPLTSRTYDGLTLTFPANWRVLTPTFLNAGVDYPIAYLTNAHVSDQCRGGSCQGPVNQVDTEQVFVAITNEPFVRTDFRLIGLVAGQPARIRTGTIPPGQCPERAQQYIFADIALRGPQEGIAIHACVGANGSTQAGQVRQMLSTARYK